MKDETNHLTTDDYYYYYFALLLVLVLYKLDLNMNSLNLNGMMYDKRIVHFRRNLFRLYRFFNFSSFLSFFFLLLCYTYTFFFSFFTFDIRYSIHEISMKYFSWTCSTIYWDGRSFSFFICQSSISSFTLYTTTFNINYTLLEKRIQHIIMYTSLRSVNVE